jgi:predicted CoA-binding protein
MSAPFTDDDVIRSILTSVRTIALVGASANPHRPSHEVMTFLQSRGYRVIPVNPGLAGQTLLGETVRADLAEIGEAVDMVDIFRNSAQAGTVADAAIAVGARVVWMQLGVIDEAAAQRGRTAGLTVIMDRCPKIEIIRLGLPPRGHGGSDRG